MRKTAKTFRANGSGQLLIVTALAIAILIASTSIYVYELTMENQNVENSSAVELALAVRTSLRNAMISALANITKSGQKTVLTENLNMLTDAYLRWYPQRICQITYTLLNGAGYVDGLRLLWSDGLGVSSQYAFFTLKILGQTSKTTINDAINITTAITVNGYYIANGNESIKIVNLTCNVFNEEKPTQAKQITLYYEASPGAWIPVDNPSMTDWGNGTYSLHFTITTASRVVHVSAHVVDARNIFVAANATCIQA
ncbi:MAG: hypothetical protein NZ932_05830 [Candidatus Bathyarchaeota archaeon]|nr:hypothetical protein [Candidatus Bathyarchaeota archaeon]